MIIIVLYIFDKFSYYLTMYWLYHFSVQQIFCISSTSAIHLFDMLSTTIIFHFLIIWQVDHLLSQLEKDLDELTLLKGYVENEALVFHKLQLFGPALSTFISTLRSIVSEISSVRDNLDCLLHNKTQAKFVELGRTERKNNREKSKLLHLRKVTALSLREIAY